MLTEFKNEQLTDFTKESVRQKFEKSVEEMEKSFETEYPIVIDGEKIKTQAKIISRDPSNHKEIVGVVSKADVRLAEKAIQIATETFKAWSKTSPEERARYLFKAASIMRRRKDELSACMVFEVGKSWVEADADTAEAIDFLEFYGREMLRLSEHQPLTRISGEDNELYYIPLGVCVVIPPWNFPLAILAGMTSAAIVSGNTVVLKPASVSPVIAYKFWEVMNEAGLPDGVLNFLPGSGGEIGNYLVSHPKTRMLAFTGSKEIGLSIVELASKVNPGQIWIKRVIAEMGGKDAIVVDETADLNAAADGITASAFGYQGQKCSACSRVIAVKQIYNTLIEKVVERTKKLTIGHVKKFENQIGPVIDELAFKKILTYIDIGKKESELVLGGEKLDIGGYFIKPTIFANVSPEARIAQEEIFGPVVAFIGASDFKNAIEIANNTEYGLTGSVYSTNRANLEYARVNFHCGNLYFNRKCTGALVGVHPFGGFNMSGTDSKAGGRDYLLLFTQAKVVSEKL